MFILVPLTFSFLVLYAYFRFWKVTLPLTGIIILISIWSYSPAAGVLVTTPVALIALWVLRIQSRDQAVGEVRAMEDRYLGAS